MVASFHGGLVTRELSAEIIHVNRQYLGGLLDVLTVGLVMIGL